MFRIVVSMEEIGAKETFEEAFVVLYRKVDELRVAGQLSPMVLNEATWIENSQIPSMPMMFGTAVDKAYQLGLLKDGKLVEQNKDKDATFEQGSDTPEEGVAGTEKN